MQFLGTIGIDPKLLIAQIINFAILLVVLNKLLYKPLISQIEKEEKDLHLAEEEKEHLLKSRQEEELKESERLSEIQKKSKEILNEAQEISGKIQEDARKEAKQAVSKIVEQAKKKIKSQEENFKKNIGQKEKKEMLQKILKDMGKNTSAQSREIVSKAFFQLLLNDINVLTFPKKTFLGSSHTKALVESSYVLSEKEIDQLRKALLQKTQLQAIELSSKQEADLIEGVRLEFLGKVIEESIVSHIGE